MNIHAVDRPVRHLSVGPRRRGPFAILAALVLAVSLAGIAFLFWPAPQKLEEKAAKAEVAVHSAPPRLKLDLPPPDLLRPLSPQEAILENQKRPFSAAPTEPSRPFTLRADDVSRFRAIDCLTQAVYYEAASEGIEGGRAVAQVVLNRVRHPAYPNTICGVVYQGSERPTCCQFTFTCDGSLGRAPAAYLWARSRMIAQEALTGRVYGKVGHATHYHADYVLPYWADSLDKLVQVGRHIFYRIRGSLGSRRAFSQRYARTEPPPFSSAASATLLDEALKITEDTEESLLPTAEEAMPKPIVDEAAPETRDTAESPLAVDGTRGVLIIDNGNAPPSAPKAKPDLPGKKAECSDKEGPGSVKAIRANQLRIGSPGC